MNDALSPRFTEQFANAQLQQQQGHYFQRVITIAPGDAGAHCNRGTALLMLNRMAAISSFDKAIEIEPRYTEAYFNRAHSRHKLREYLAAVADYKKVAALAPDFE
jgi:tetratricopeptide (TPR) repeat protein